MSNCILPGIDGESARIKSFRAAVDALKPALDSVEVWLTPTVEQDYQLRGVFPELRARSAVAARSASGWGLHLLSIEQAELVLADCALRVKEVPGGVMNAYHGHERRLRTAVSEARTRTTLFASRTPLCLSRTETSERWRGTTAQFAELGIQTVLEGTGARAPKKLKTCDSRGYAAHVCASSSLWPGLFEVTVSLPRRPARPAPHDAEASALARLPDKPDHLRNELIVQMGFFWKRAEALMKRPIGYHYSDEANADFTNAIAQLYTVLKDGEIIGLSRVGETRRVALANARSDSSLQNFISKFHEHPTDPDA